MAKTLIAKKVLPQQQPNNLSQKMVAVRVSERFTGPIPHPKIIEEYERICPGSASRIITMAESQTSHRQKLEAKVISSKVENEKLGMRYSFLILVLFIIVGAILLMADKEVAGYFTLFGPAVVQFANYGFQKYKESKTPKKDNSDIEAKRKSITKRQAPAKKV